MRMTFLGWTYCSYELESNLKSKIELPENDREEVSENRATVQLDH